MDNIDLSEFKKVEKAFPNVYNMIIKRLCIRQKDVFDASSTKTLLENEGLFEFLYYLMENLKTGNKLAQILSTFKHRVVKTRNSTSKPYYSFIDGYLYENNELDSDFYYNANIEAIVAVSSLKLYFEEKYQSEHAPIVALSKVLHIIEKFLQKKDNEKLITSTEFAEIAIMKGIYNNIRDYFVEFAIEHKKQEEAENNVTFD